MRSTKFPLYGLAAITMGLGVLLTGCSLNRENHEVNGADPATHARMQVQAQAQIQSIKDNPHIPPEMKAGILQRMQMQPQVQAGRPKQAAK